MAGVGTPDPEKMLRRDTLSWCDDELHPALGTDVCQTPLDTDRGWQRYSTATVGLLVMRAKSQAPEPLAAFVGVDIPELLRVDAGENKAYRSPYSDFLSRVRLSPEALNLV